MAKKKSTETETISIEKPDFLSAVHKSLKTPVAELKFCYITKPFFYTGSHIPRYSVTLAFDKGKVDHLDFLQILEDEARANKVETIGVHDKGVITIKFQGKDCPKIFATRPGQKTPKPIQLEHDLAPGAKTIVEFDLNTYYNKTTGKNGFNFAPKKVIFHLDEPIVKKTIEKSKNNADNKNSRNRRKPKSHGLGSSKLLPPKKRSMGK